MYVYQSFSKILFGAVDILLFTAAAVGRNTVDTCAELLADADATAFDRLCPVEAAVVQTPVRLALVVGGAFPKVWSATPWEASLRSLR